MVGLGTADIDRFYQKLQLPGGGRSGRALAPATVRRVHGILRRALEQALRWGWIGKNPAASASPPRVPLRDTSVPDPAELVRVLRAANEREPDLALFILVAAATGARRSEVLALRWSAIDLAAGFVTIDHALVMGPNGLVEKDTKTHSVRRVSLDTVTVESLRARYKRAADTAAFVGVSACDGVRVQLQRGWSDSLAS